MFLRSSKLGTMIVALTLVSMGFWSVGQVANAANPSHQTHKAHATKAAAACKKVSAKGTVKYSDWQFPSTMNGYQSSQAVRALVAAAIFDGLFSINEKAQYVPFMMTKYPTVKNGGISKDGKTVTVVLKSGLKWSDGRALTASDEKFGWQVDMNQITGPTCLGYCDVIKKFDVVNKTTVKLTLKHPAPTDEVISYDIWPAAGWPNAYSKGDVKGAATWLEDAKTNFEDSSYPTNGPYKITEFTAGNRIVMAPNPNYKDFTCGAAIKQLIFAGYTSKANMEAAAASHDTDMTQDYTAADLPALSQHSDAYKIWNSPAFIIEHLELNVSDPTVHGHPNALTNVKVRQALNLAVDKLGLIESALALPASTAKTVEAWNPWIVTPKFAMQYADKSINGAWDPLAKGKNGAKGAFVTPHSSKALADAKKLLSQAGFANGNNVTVDIESTAGNPTRLQQMNILKANWAELGVTTNVTQSSTFLAGWDSNGDLNHGNFSAADFAWLLGPDPDADYKSFFLPQYIERKQANPSDSQANYTGTNDKTITKDFNQAYTTASPSVKTKDYKAIQNLVVKNVYWIPLYYRPTLATTDSAFTGFKLNPTSADDSWNVFDWRATAS